MIRAILGLAFEGLALYVALSFLTCVMALPHAVAHWGFLGIVSAIGLPALMRAIAGRPA